MKERSWILVLLGIVTWAFLPKGIAEAAAVGNIEWICSTGVSPFTFTTVAANSSEEQQVLCADDADGDCTGGVALGGGVEVEEVPLPPDVVVTTPENSFHFTGTTADGWQVVLQNTNLLPICLLPSFGGEPEFGAPASMGLCPSVHFRVCVSCACPAT